MPNINDMEGEETQNFAENYDGFENACRSCWAKDGTVDLFQTSHEDMLLGQIYEKLLASSQVNEGDYLPSKLCVSCTGFVMHYYAFRKRALDSEIILQTLCREQQIRKQLDDGNDFRIEIVIESDTEINQEMNESSAACNHNYSKSNDLSITEINAVEEGDMKEKLKKKGKPETSKYVKKVHSKTNITCSFCKNIFPTLSEYLIHRKREASKRRKKLPCKYCNKLVKTNVLRDHMNTHTKEQPYECNVCKVTFSMRSSLLRHKHTHRDKKPLECATCGKGFIQAPLLEDHIRKHTGEKLICNFCQKEFTIRRRFDRHIKVHTSAARIIYQETTAPVSCKTCSQQFQSAYELINHMFTHIEKFLCSICDKDFKTNDALKQHAFMHTGIRPHICEICGKGFNQKSQLQSHNMTHTTEKPFLCIICGRRFKWRGHVVHHMRTHTGERPYECRFCDMTFSRPDYAKNHLRTHTREKPFTCELCPKAYRYPYSLRKHKRTHEV